MLVLVGKNSPEEQLRVQKTSDGLTVQVVGGSHVVLIGWDYPKNKCKGLAGFGVHRTDPEEEEAGWLRGIKTFEATDPGLPPGSQHSTRQHPIQSFLWSDYRAKPERTYTSPCRCLERRPDRENLAVDRNRVAVAFEISEARRQCVGLDPGNPIELEHVGLTGDRSSARCPDRDPHPGDIDRCTESILRGQVKKRERLEERPVSRHPSPVDLDAPGVGQELVVKRDADHGPLSEMFRRDSGETDS